jgi:hypothetical protein
LQPLHVLGMLGVVILLAARADAAQFELNARTLGDRLDAVLDDERYECAGESACFLMLSCRLKHPAGERLHGFTLDSLTLHYAGERVAAIEAQLPAEAFSVLREAGLRDYGEPESMQAGLFVWRQGSRVLRLEHAADSSGHTRLIISQQSFLGELIEPR